MPNSGRWGWSLAGQYRSNDQVSEYPWATRLDRVQVRWGEEGFEEERSSLIVVEVDKQGPVQPPRPSVQLTQGRGVGGGR